MTAETKLRTLAKASPALQEYFGAPTGIFRWFDKQLLPGYIQSGTCARVFRVSTLLDHVHETESRQSLSGMQRPRFQIDVLDYDPERARSAAAAIIDWLSTVDFSSGAQFASPPTSPTRHPNFVLNQRAGMEYQLDPPAHVETLDVRIFNLEE